MDRIDELTSHCIRCGFCLESCPTFQLTGRETDSPRGRIYLIRSASEGKMAWSEARQAVDRCLGCRACETACPSGVEYGAILEIARDTLERQREARTRGALLRMTSDPARLRRQLALGRFLPGSRVPTPMSLFLSGQRAEAERPVAQRAPDWPPLREAELPEVRGEVYLLEGCAMRVLFPAVHEATRRLLRRLGYKVRASDAGCCGALHAHNGHLEEARQMSGALERAMAGDLPVIVNSAGCGSWLKDEGAGFGTRVLDVSEFLSREGLEALLAGADPWEVRIAYHDACHLAHGQGVRAQPRELLGSIPGADLVPLGEADTCCGSAGIYNLTQPALARQLLQRKWANVEASGAEFVALGNPGCHAWIAQAAREKRSRVRVMHTAEILEAALSGVRPVSSS